MSILTIENLECRHGLLIAVRGISLSVNEGETLALVGANGAGKTTLMRSIAGAHKASAGRIMFDGQDVTALKAHKRVGLGIALVPEGRKLFTGMTVEENLKVAGAHGRKGDWNLEKVLEAFPQLKPKLKARAGDLSGGQQQATAIGRALMTNPRLLLLDEVSLGLSPLAVDQVYNSLSGLMNGGTTIILVEQDLNRAIGVSTRIACMLEGSKVLEGPAKDLTREQITAAYFGLNRSRKQEAGAA
jgi:branched-chain amino acid transport system ATP-binding protein